MNLARRPGSAGEGAAALKQAKRLQERIDGLEGRDTARDAAQEAESHQPQDDSLKEFWRKREAESRRAREAKDEWEAESRRARTTEKDRENQQKQEAERLEREAKEQELWEGMSDLVCWVVLTLFITLTLNVLPSVLGILFTVLGVFFEVLGLLFVGLYDAFWFAVHEPAKAMQMAILMLLLFMFILAWAVSD